MVACGKGKYHGEKCFLKGGKYPYTQNGRVSTKRIRNAMARAQQNNEGDVIKSKYCKLARRHHIKSEYC